MDMCSGPDSQEAAVTVECHASSIGWKDDKGVLPYVIPVHNLRRMEQQIKSVG